MAEATITLKLDVIPAGQGSQGKVLVPGQEPGSDSTSNTLLANLHGKPALANVADVLAAIPGSRIQYADNWANNLGRRKAWLVLPPVYQGCCQTVQDYYQKIRDVATNEEPEVEKHDACDAVDQSFCPSPDWKMAPKPPADPYQPEGAGPYGAISYTPGTLPPWNNPNPTKKLPGEEIYNQ